MRQLRRDRSPEDAAEGRVVRSGIAAGSGLPAEDAR